KNDQLVTRQFRDETNAAVYLVLDSSASMGFAGEGSVTKLEYAVVLAASLAMMAFGQRDAVSVAFGAGEPAAFLPPRNSAPHLRQALQMLETLRPGGETDLEHLFAAHATRRAYG